jgi:hypothetical protein
MSITPAPRAKIIYVNNKELLSEINKSKKTFCSFIEPEHSDFDTIVHSVDEITPELIEAVREKKSKPRGKPAIPLDQLPPEGIVVRVMTYEHIPLDPDRVRKSRVTDKSYARTNFPPYKHYVLLADGPKEVLRSHWTGGFDNGHFNIEHGKINNKLAVMFMLIVERYSKRGNWRNYCVDDQTEALTQRGWLRYDEITEMDTILSYDQGDLKWSKIKSIFRNPDYDDKMFHLTVRGMDALVTPEHKFITQDGLKKVEELKLTDSIILCGDGAKVDLNWATHMSVLVSDIDFHGAYSQGGSLSPTIPYKGIIWCPETEYGSFMCRRNGHVFLTGNTYNDEMRGMALMQLSQVGLQFDESKSENPFAFYTQIINNSFKRTLNIEKKSQNIRDDLLIIAGASPSYTRQIDNELEHRFPSDNPTAKKKGGYPRRAAAPKSEPPVAD